MNIPPDITDARAEFATRFGALTPSIDKGNAQAWLTLSSDNPSPRAKSVSNGTIRRVPNLLVPGLMGDSVRSIVAPLAFAKKTLALDGYNIDVLWVNGRQGCDKNAAALYPQVMAAAQHYGRPVRLIGYSKGCTDILHLLANHTDCHSAIDSIVSLAGVVLGTPLAARTPRWLDRLFQYFPLPGVAFGDGRALDDLAPEYRRRWLSEHPLPSNIRYASVVAIPAGDRVSRVLKAGYLQLAKITADNDSQVIAADSLLPNSELLAMVNADHWAVALPIGRTYPTLSRWLIDQNEFPRTRLLQTIIDHLDATPLVP